mmetsp:Transcript_13558/g.22147  ORF Transcript_13558/g.22147 Transcript_13558/m.22147 type:complete len:180 (+) Transcript_13558:631-1170(+)
MVLGLRLAGFVETHKHLWWVAWAIFCLLTIIHLVANYFAVKSLQLRTINGARLSILIDLFEKDGKLADFTVENVNSMQPVIAEPKFNFRIGVRVSHMSRKTLLSLEDQTCVLASKCETNYRLVLREDSTAREILKYLFREATHEPEFMARRFIEKLELNGWDLKQLYLIDDKYRIQISK